MKKQNSNPICPYSKKACINFTENLDCKTCPEYGNGVRASGGMPILAWILNKLKLAK